MKVLLIRPKPHKETIGLQNVMICEPLELEYLAANAEAVGHTTEIVDMILEKKRISYFLEKYKPDVVGLTGYIAHVNVIKNHAKQIKQYDSEI
ncbi:MAG: cobalamin-dependent protein, partial [Lachnospiraceae bacterium]|nr:cobalamin-dependent protein [Lachnospiraceae bacterium]